MFFFLWSKVKKKGKLNIVGTDDEAGLSLFDFDAGGTQPGRNKKVAQAHFVVLRVFDIILLRSPLVVEQIVAVDWIPCGHAQHISIGPKSFFIRQMFVFNNDK